MKMTKIILIIFSSMMAIYLSSCAELENFVEIMVSDNDSTQVRSADKKTLEKPSNKTIDEWEIYGNAEIDKNRSFDEYEGSIKLAKTAETWQATDKVISKNRIPVIPGKTYQLDFKIMTKTWPPPTIHAAGEFHNNNKKLFNGEGTYFSNSVIDRWENNTLYIQVPNNSEIKYYYPKISMLPKYGKNADIWIDNISLTEVVIDRKRPDANKKEFTGSLTKVDKLGNIEIFRNGKWQPIFIFGIYADKNRSNWKTYSKQGFNTNMWASSSRIIKKGSDVGLYSNLQIGQYVIDVDWLPKDNAKKINHLENTISKIKSDRLMDKVIFYYIDNEFYKISDELINVTNTIKSLDIDKNGQRMHPIYMLNGAYGIARKYNNISDITGTYVAQDRTGIPLSENFTGLQINENQKQPAVIAQINRGVGLSFRPILFGAIAKGAKGFGFWRDGGSGIDIEKAAWWNDFPNMVKEIEQMMPLIRESHFTDWTVECDNDAIIFGSRMLKNKGHLIIANPTNSKVQANFTISDLPYSISLVKDYFSGDIAGDINMNIITITLNPYGTKIVRID